MFKNNQKRYEYDISSNMPEQIQRYAYRYPKSKIGSQHVSSTATPINKKSILTHQANEQRARNHESFHQYQNRFLQRNQEGYAQRGKANSTSAMKKSANKHYELNDKSYLGNDNMKQTKKIYFGGEGLYQKESQPKNNKFQPKFNDQNKRFNGQNVNHSFQNERFDQGNKRGETTKDFQRQKRHQVNNLIHQNTINEKQIMQKIGRINKLNEEINNRLQRMLSKIDS